MARRAARRHRHTKQPQATQPVAEMIGRVAAPYLQSSLYRNRSASITTVDATVPDYAYWDTLRRCKLPGYRLGGLFAKRIEQVLSSWIFGEGVNVTLNKDIAAQYSEAAVMYTNEQLANFIGGLLDSGQDNEGDDPDLDDVCGAALTNIYKAAVGLGDQYVIVNADGSLSIPSPDTVEVIRDDFDYRRVLAIKVTTKLPKVTIIDEYRADGRTVTYKTMVDSKEVVTVETYANLIGRINAIHVAYGRSGNETNGHSIHEELRPLYDQYDDVLEKMLDGAKLLGNPFLAFTGLENLTAVIDLNQPATPEQYYDAGGNVVDRPAMNIDRNSVFAIGKGGDAKFVSPPVGFTEDTKATLNVLFWLLFEHLGIPESVWGGELSSARATSETQLGQFVKELRGWQTENGGWIVKLCKIWLQFKALTDPQIIVDKLSAEWPAAIEQDKALLLNMLKVAKDEGVITGETMLRLLELVDDPEDEAAKGKAEADAMAQQQQQQAIDLAQATKPPVNSKAVGVAQMSGEGYNGDEATAIVVGAIRQLAGGE
jgi:hypothetical protein